MRFILLLIYLPLLTAPVFAQTTFHKKWAGSLIFDACPLETGGVLLAGYNSPRNSLAVRLDDAGAIIWSKSYAPMHDICNVLEVPDGYIIAGDSLVPDGPNDNARYTIIAKLSPTGEVIWSQALGGFNLDIRSKQLTATSSGFIFSGTQQLVSFPSRIEPLIIRFDYDGDVQWSKTYTTEFNTFNGELYAQHVEGDTLFACGDIHGNACFIRLNYHSGELMEWRTFGGPFVENLSSMFQLNDGNYLMAGSTRSTTFSEADRCWIVNTDRHGQMRWSKVFNISGMNQRAWLTKSNDGNFVFSAGRGYNNGSSSIPILCKISPEGQPIWAYDYSGGTPFSLNQLSSTADGGLLAVNYNTLLKTDAEGRVLNGCCPAP
ncbi:MAG: hypothetical protein SFV22_10810, partial [Saprospiraceae bacterium]|nr:hypothetical protein [Saprospiraceae bacterium]